MCTNGVGDFFCWDGAWDEVCLSRDLPRGCPCSAAASGPRSGRSASSGRGSRSPCRCWSAAAREHAASRSWPTRRSASLPRSTLPASGMPGSRHQPQLSLTRRENRRVRRGRFRVGGLRVRLRRPLLARSHRRGGFRGSDVTLLMCAHASREPRCSFSRALSLIRSVFIYVLRVTVDYIFMVWASYC